MRAKLFVKQTQQKNKDRENGRGRMKRNDVAKPFVPARRVINIVSREPNFVAPDINQQDGQRAENIETSFFDGNCFMPASHKRISVETYSKHGVLVRESEEAQSKEHIQQNAAGGNDQRSY